MKIHHLQEFLKVLFLSHFYLEKNNESYIGIRSKQLKIYIYQELFVNIQEQHLNRYQKEPYLLISKEKKKRQFKTFSFNANKNQIYSMTYD